MALTCLPLSALTRRGTYFHVQSECPNRPSSPRPQDQTCQQTTAPGPSAMWRPLGAAGAATHVSVIGEHTRMAGPAGHAHHGLVLQRLHNGRQILVHRVACSEWNHHTGRRSAQTIPQPWPIQELGASSSAGPTHRCRIDRLRLAPSCTTCFMGEEKRTQGLSRPNKTADRGGTFVLLILLLARLSSRALAPLRPTPLSEYPGGTASDTKSAPPRLKICTRVELANTGLRRETG